MEDDDYNHKEAEEDDLDAESYNNDVFFQGFMMIRSWLRQAFHLLCHLPLLCRPPLCETYGLWCVVEAGIGIQGMI